MRNQYIGRGKTLAALLLTAWLAACGGGGDDPQVDTPVPQPGAGSPSAPLQPLPPALPTPSQPPIALPAPFVPPISTPPTVPPISTPPTAPPISTPPTAPLPAPSAPAPAQSNVQLVSSGRTAQGYQFTFTNVGAGAANCNTTLDLTRVFNGREVPTFPATDTFRVGPGQTVRRETNLTFSEFGVLNTSTVTRARWACGNSR
jgi:hypothetical protein